MEQDLGIYSVKQLHEAGYDRRALDKLVSVERLTRAKRGWYVTPNPNPEALHALKLGGRLGCISAGNAAGLFIPPTEKHRLHVILPEHFSLPQADACFHRSSARPDGICFPIEDSLRQVLAHHDPETALILLESAVAKKKITYDFGWSLIRELPRYKQLPLKFFDCGAQSGSETRTRLFFQRRKVPVKTQQFIRGVGWVDMIAGNSLVVECDSQAYHTSDYNYHEDRKRDLEADYFGYDVIRLSFAQIWYQWEDTQLRLSERLKSRRHRYGLRLGA